MLLVKRLPGCPRTFRKRRRKALRGIFHNVPQSTSPADNSICEQPFSGNAFHGQGVKLFGQSFHWGTVILLAFISVVIFVYISFYDKENDSLYWRNYRVDQKIAQGDFSTKVEVKYENEFAIIAQNLNIMAKDLYELKEKEHEAENTKNELITNVPMTCAHHWPRLSVIWIF